MSQEPGGQQEFRADGSSVQYASQYGSVHINNYYGAPPPETQPPAPRLRVPRRSSLTPSPSERRRSTQWYRRLRRWAVARSLRPRDAGWTGGCLVPMVYWFSVMMLAARGTEKETTDSDQWVLIRTMVALSGAVFFYVWGRCVRLPKDRAAAAGLGFFMITGVILAFVEDALTWFGVVFCLMTGLCVAIGARAMRRR